MIMNATTFHYAMNQTSDITTDSLFGSVSGTAENMNAPYQRPFDDTGIAVTATIIFTFLVIGLVGNGLTITVITFYDCLRTNVFMRFILSLCVSDLISALISWLFLYRRTWGFDDWSPLPPIFCKFYWAADFMTSYVTAMHILSFATLRLVSMKFPIAFNKLEMKHAHIWIGLIWLVGFLGGFIPAWIMFGATTPDRNSDQPNARFPACTVLVSMVDNYRLFQNTTFPIFLCIPTAGVVTICTILIVMVKVRSKRVPASKKQEKELKKEQQAVVQLSLIICAFLLGYIPFMAYEFWSIQEFPQEQYYYEADYWFGMTEYLFLRFSECLNPLFYNLGSGKMRKFTKRFLKEIVFCSRNTVARPSGRGGFSTTRGATSSSHTH